MHGRRPHLLIALLVLAACATLTPAAGAATPRIIGGRVATPGQFPWIVALVSGGRDASDGQFCGGSVIAADLVATAAHCVTGTDEPADLDVVIGIDRLSGERGGQRIGVTHISVDPGWQTRPGHDMAVLRLAQPTTVAPLALAGAGDVALNRPGARVAVAGWGAVAQNPERYTDQLRMTTLTVLPDRRCTQALDGYVRFTMLCASSRRTDSCDGDSGGPLVSFSSGHPVMIGLVSWGLTRCADGYAPGVYTRVTGEAGWLAKVLAAPAPAPAPPPTG